MVRRTWDYVEVVLRVANSAAVSAPGRARQVTRNALTEPGHFGKPDVVLLSEVAPVLVAGIMLRGVEVGVVQHGRAGQPEAGVAVAVRGDAAADHLHELGLRIGSPRTSEGGGIRMRPIVGARAFRTPWWAVHAPPPRSPIARALYIARARTRRGVIGGDWNQTPTWMRRTTRRQYRGIGVLGVIIPAHIDASPAYAVEIGSDHPAVDVRLRIPRRSRRVRITHTKENRA